MKAFPLRPWPALLGLLAWATAWSLPLQAAPLQAADLAPLERIANEEIAAGHVPGAVILVGQGKHIVYRRAFGLRAVVPAEEAMTPDTVFDLASLTKVVVTTTAVLQLEEKGQLDLDAPAATYWPAFTGQGKDSITLRQLLTHTSGLPPGLEARLFPEKFDWPVKTDFLQAEIKRLLDEMQSLAR